MTEDKNKLEKTLEDYKCKNCGTLHVTIYQENKPFKRCRRCFKPSGWSFFA